ncbi:MAG: inosine monophosphate cyclohydrolase [Chloroflexi bacterium]|jgi:IMP cyclohydrolase|nr:inosine monophosphate cyclohydrolase [Chloroflexota bacterium]MBT7080907.1 inosine monophosphate cyclohydrolase [Chloroflexota bacterium]MBT7289072.1 inosine monophosphate cyclohydrolase [Chloroflexota bacterium]
MQDIKSYFNGKTYPGRGIVIGLSPDEKAYYQIYWIMGRSENSRNRVFIKEENNFVRTEAHDKVKMEDPSLIIYYPIKHVGVNTHIVSNGDQTDTIVEYISSGKSFEQAIASRTYEPDPPNYTPRIAGIIDTGADDCAYKLAIMKSNNNQPEHAVKNVFAYASAIPGIGHCITTYVDDGNPLPSFEGEPVAGPIYDRIDDNLVYYWKLINNDNLISILVKRIEIVSSEVNILIRNNRC